MLAAKLIQSAKQSAYNKRTKKRREQVGSGGRGEEKIRTIRVQEGQVYDHINNQTISYKAYSRGRLGDLNK